jgi:hypothetical protein
MVDFLEFLYEFYKKLSAKNLETDGGYAKEAGEDFKKKQEELLKNSIKNNNFDKYKVMKFFNFQESRNSKYCNGINLFKNLN